MSNTILTPTAVTRRAMEIFHNNLVFAKKVNRQYDDQFAKSGAKIGQSLKIRTPNEFTVRTGATINVQDISESYETLTLATQKGVDVNFTSLELTMDLDDFSERILEPAMARLASQVDYEGLSLFADIYNHVGAARTTPTTALVALQAGQKLDEFCTPQSQRSVVISPAANASMVDGLKALFAPQGKIGSQYTKGGMGQALGFDWAMSQNVNSLTCGTRDLAPEIYSVGVEAADDVVFDGCTAETETVTAGECFTIAGVYAVNPETKESTGSLQGFVNTALATGNDTRIAMVVKPELYADDGVTKTITGLPQVNDLLLFGAPAAATTDALSVVQNLAFHKDAFCLATADLVLPKGVDFASRQVYDGISIRIVRQYDINNDTFPCRIDVLYGWKTIRPEWACRILG
jgi:hypothetical protein